MNALDQQYVDGNEQRFNKVADSEPTDLDEMVAALNGHLAYLDGQAAACTDSASRETNRSQHIWMASAASVYEEVAAELRHTLRMEQP
jgi:hypothetical protein